MAIRNICIWVLLTALHILYAPAVAGERIVVFKGTPLTKIENTTREKCEKFDLNEKEKVEYRVLITKEIVDGKEKYFWASREDKELIHTISGMFHIFHAKHGAGYIKVRRKNEVSILTYGDYIEHMNYHLATITYWGEGIEFGRGLKKVQ